ncbi:MAG: Penicillin amidase [Gemmatimonadetes bacterium]|nr:Penicillin amidase [Gemmatimonadota bacterium]
MQKRRSVIALTAAMLLAPVAGQAYAQGDTAKLAASVTIHRDEYGVPHVIARTDAGAAFGFAYAQAEDNFWRVEENYIRALGRASEVYGDTAFKGDVLNRTLDISTLARRDYSRLDVRTRALCDAFAAGLNLYITRHRSEPRLLQHVEPWYPLAFIRYLYYQNGFANDRALSGATSAIVRTAYESSERDEARNFGSNGWVVGPSRSVSGHPLLLINPHLPFFGTGQVYEGHVISDEGWNFTGYSRFGFPLPYVGHNADLGWVSTDNAADMADVYTEDVDSSGTSYRYGSKRRRIIERADSIRIAVGSGFEVRRIKVRSTHHGPIVAMIGGRSLALRMAKTESSGWLPEWYAMTRARTLVEFKRAMAPLDMLFGNVMYADRAGNTFYIYNGAVPRRDERFDWTKPVDGGNPATEWSGYHSMNELPQLTNPATGWMQNCNTTPFLLTSSGNPDSSKYPSYMVREGDNPRGRASRALLAQPKQFTFEEWSHLAFDTRAFSADSMLALLFRIGLAPNASAAESGALDEMRRWDRRATVHSVATTLYATTRELIPQRVTATDSVTPRTALRLAINSLVQRFGTWQVPWGDVNRLQRRDEARNEPFNDERPSVAVPGMNGADGAIFTFYARRAPDQQRNYGTSGATYVSVVEFAPEVRARSIHVFGASGDPRSAHFADQSPLYAGGEFKPAWFTRREVLAHATRSYHPGS